MLGISSTGKLDENQRSRQLLKVLAISDVVIFKTRFVESIITFILTSINNQGSCTCRLCIFHFQPIAQRCVLPVSFPVDLLLLHVVVNPPETKVAKRMCIVPLLPTLQ